MRFAAGLLRPPRPTAGRGGLGRGERLLFLVTGAGEDAGEGVVALMAGVFVKRPLGGVQRHLTAVWSGVDLRIGDGEAVLDLAGVHAGEPLDHLQLRRGAAE